MNKSFNFLCLCPPSLAAMLNFNISKVVYCKEKCDVTKNLKREQINVPMQNARGFF